MIAKPEWRPAIALARIDERITKLRERAIASGDRFLWTRVDRWMERRARIDAHYHGRVR